MTNEQMKCAGACREARFKLPMGDLAKLINRMHRHGPSGQFAAQCIDDLSEALENALIRAAIMLEESK